LRVNVIHTDSVVMTSACISLVKRQSGIQLQTLRSVLLPAPSLRSVRGAQSWLSRCAAGAQRICLTLTPSRTWATRGALPPGQDSPEPINPTLLLADIVQRVWVRRRWQMGRGRHRAARVRPVVLSSPEPSPGLAGARRSTAARAPANGLGRNEVTSAGKLLLLGGRTSRTAASSGAA